MYFLPRVSTAREESAGQRGGEGGRSGSGSEIVGGGEQSRPQVPQVLGRGPGGDEEGERPSGGGLGGGGGGVGVVAGARGVAAASAASAKSSRASAPERLAAAI